MTCVIPYSPLEKKESYFWVCAHLHHVQPVPYPYHTLTWSEIKHWPEGKSNTDQTGYQTLTYCKIKLWLAVKSKLCWPEVKPNTNPTIKSNTSRWSKVQYWLSLQLVTPDSLYCLPISSKSNSLYVSPVVLLRCCCYFSPSENTTNSKEKVTRLTDAQACNQLQ